MRVLLKLKKLKKLKVPAIEVMIVEGEQKDVNEWTSRFDEAMNEY